MTQVWKNRKSGKHAMTIGTENLMVMADAGALDQIPAPFSVPLFDGRILVNRIASRVTVDTISGVRTVPAGWVIWYVQGSEALRAAPADTFRIDHELVG